MCRIHVCLVDVGEYVSEALDSCPLSDETCLNGLSKFQVYHNNLTLRDYGLKVQSALRHSRGLTCTPLALPVLFPWPVTHRNWKHMIK